MDTIEIRDNHNLVVLFDGDCNLCDGTVQFIIKHDRAHRFRFAALQSEAARRLSPEDADKEGELRSVVLIEDGKVYRESTAALHIARYLDGPWSLFFAFIVIPAPIRDAVYRLIARNRYRWFGKREACLMPTGELRRRFLTE
ncbi:MAG: thiol-disulfide oxidoreductase DCC family protein [Armatimonadaceae bacterium]